MELHGHFQYGSKSSREYGIMLANVSTKRNLLLGGSVETVGAFSRRGIKNYFVKDDYSDSAISFDVEFVVDDDRCLTHAEQRGIRKWLFYAQGYWPLYLDEFDDIDGANSEIGYNGKKRLYLNCRFTNPEVIEGNGGICGYKATLEADSPYAWQDATELTYELNNAANGVLITVDVDSDINEYIYPKVTIQTGSTGGDVTIFNSSDDSTRLTSFSDLAADTQIVMVGDIGMISGQNYQKFHNKNFIRFLDGENRLSITGDLAGIKFEWKNRRYVS